MRVEDPSGIGDVEVARSRSCRSRPWPPGRRRARATRSVSSIGESLAVEGRREAAELLARHEQRLDARAEGDVQAATATVRGDQRDRRVRRGPWPRGWCPFRTPARRVERRPTVYSALTISPIFWPASVGFRQTCTPAAARASIFACAVPLEPEMMAPAWPIFRPGGAVTPAM